MIETRKEAPNDIIPKKRLTHYSILLTQLVNGARISEALDAVSGWSADPERERQIQVRKLGKIVRCNECGTSFSNRSKVNSPAKHSLATGHKKKGFVEIPIVEYRLVVIPSECLLEDRPYIQESLERGLTIGAVKAFALRNLKFNTHSLRYAKITALSASGTPAQMVAKITHHKNLSFITDYTSQKVADETLRKSVG